MGFTLKKSQFSNPEFSNMVDAIYDGAGVWWVLVLSKNSHGAEIYKVTSTSATRVETDTTYSIGVLREGMQGHLVHIGFDQDGNLVLSDPIPGYTPRIH